MRAKGNTGDTFLHDDTNDPPDDYPATVGSTNPRIRRLELHAFCFKPDIDSLAALATGLPELEILAIGAVGYHRGTRPDISFPKLHTIQYGSDSLRQYYDYNLQMNLGGSVLTPQIRRLFLRGYLSPARSKSVWTSYADRLECISLRSSDERLLNDDSVLLLCLSLRELVIYFDGSLPFPDRQFPFPSHGRLSLIHLKKKGGAASQWPEDGLDNLDCLVQKIGRATLPSLRTVTYDGFIGRMLGVSSNGTSRWSANLQGVAVFMKE